VYEPQTTRGAGAALSNITNHLFARTEQSSERRVQPRERRGRSLDDACLDAV